MKYSFMLNDGLLFWSFIYCVACIQQRYCGKSSIRLDNT